MRLGVQAIFDPGSHRANEIIPQMQDIRRQNVERPDADSLWEGLRQGDTKALAQFITLLARGNSRPQEILDEFFENNDVPCHVVGVSGSAGVGKSSLLARLLVETSESTGALFVDPCTVSGGALLGDRMQLQALIANMSIPVPRHVYARSVAAYESFRGATLWTPSIINTMKAAGKRVVFVESMGMGQEDSGFSSLVDTFIHVVSPDIGEMQVMKGGEIETENIIVLNKCDRPGSHAIASSLKLNWGRMRPDGWGIPVIKTSSFTGQGIPELWKAIREHKKSLDHGAKEAR